MNHWHFLNSVMENVESCTKSPTGLVAVNLLPQLFYLSKRITNSFRLEAKLKINQNIPAAWCRWTVQSRDGAKQKCKSYPNKQRLGQGSGRHRLIEYPKSN